MIGLVLLGVLTLYIAPVPLSVVHALARVAAQLNRAHEETKFVKTILENMAGRGNIIGADFEDLRDIIEQVKDKDRVGVCLDACHLFVCGPYP